MKRGTAATEYSVQHRWGGPLGRATFLLALVVSSPMLVEADELPEELQDLSIELRPASEQETRRISLDEALDIALAENTELALARAEEQLARGTRFTAQATLYPALEVGLGARRLDGRVQGSFGELRDVAFSTYVGGVALVYGANVAARLKQALAERKNLEASSLNSLDTEQRLLLHVVELYQDLILATVAVQISEEVVAGSEQFLTLVKVRTEGGLGLGADVARAEAKLAADQQQLVQARNLRVDISTRLAVVLRLDVDTRLAPADERLAPAQYYGASDSLPADGVRGRPDVQAAHKRANAAQQLSSAAKWDLYAPELRAEIGQLSIGGISMDGASVERWFCGASRRLRSANCDSNVPRNTWLVSA